MEYTRSLVEVDEILNYLDENELNKIPKEIRESIKKQKDKNYIWKYETNKSLNEQNIDRKTVAILSVLNMRYLLNEEQKQVMEDIHRYNEQKKEEEKLAKYQPNDIFSKNTESKVEKEKAVVEIKPQRWYEKLRNFIYKILKRK